MGNKIDFEECGKQILKKYLEASKEEYGYIPKHCYETKIEFIDPARRIKSHADLMSNKIIINKFNDGDLEWEIFHEMEHIRTANNIYNNMQTGIRGEGLTTELNSVNEALTELAVSQLLKRKKQDVYDFAYLETVYLTRQLGALISLTDDRLLLKFYKTNGYNEFKQYIINALKDENAFYTIQHLLENLHKKHLDDLYKEYDKKGFVENIPLGKSSSLLTKLLRRSYQRFLQQQLKTLKTKQIISNEEYIKRLSLVKKYNPYKTKNFQIFEGDYTMSNN